mmetsp:Transcript_11129/g.24849  ORF Transcript_11129/g.24849 Transcript_11129/m.24849 type:complete len:250 (+) Transcript_11129:46-795(+)
MEDHVASGLAALYDVSTDHAAAAGDFHSTEDAQSAIAVPEESLQRALHRPLDYEYFPAVDPFLRPAQVHHQESVLASSDIHAPRPHPFTSLPTNVMGTKLQYCGGRELCASAASGGKDVCVHINGDFAKELGNGALQKPGHDFFQTRCMSNQTLGKWFTDAAHKHRGVADVNCEATSADAFEGNDDAADFIFSRCPGALAPPSVPHKWRWPSEVLPPKDPNFPRLCADPFYFIGNFRVPDSLKIGTSFR